MGGSCWAGPSQGLGPCVRLSACLPCLGLHPTGGSGQSSRHSTVPTTSSRFFMVTPKGLCVPEVPGSKCGSSATKLCPHLPHNGKPKNIWPLPQRINLAQAGDCALQAGIKASMWEWGGLLTSTHPLSSPLCFCSLPSWLSLAHLWLQARVQALGPVTELLCCR